MCLVAKKRLRAALLWLSLPPAHHWPHVYLRKGQRPSIVNTHLPMAFHVVVIGFLVWLIATGRACAPC